MTQGLHKIIDRDYRHGHRVEGYGPFDYFGEFGDVIAGIKALNVDVANNLIGPSLATGDWYPEGVL